MSCFSSRRRTTENKEAENWKICILLYNTYVFPYLSRLGTTGIREKGVCSRVTHAAAVDNCKVLTEGATPHPPPPGQDLDRGLTRPGRPMIGLIPSFPRTKRPTNHNIVMNTIYVYIYALPYIVVDTIVCAITVPNT